MATSEQIAPDVTNNAGARRFEIVMGDQTAFLDYLVSNGRLYLVHTEVPPALEGRGLGGKLARFGLEYATREHLRVVAQCPFVRRYIERHPEDAAGVL